MKKLLSFTLALTLVFALAACAAQQPPAPEESNAPSDAPAESAVVGMANPWTDYNNLADAEAAAGFAFPQPEWAEAYDTVMYRVTEGIIEVIYAQDDGQYLVLRKGADETDVSGDYNAYDFTETRDGVTVKGYSDAEGGQLCHAAAWVADGHFFAIYCELSVTLDEMLDMTQRITEAQ